MFSDAFFIATFIHFPQAVVWILLGFSLSSIKYDLKKVVLVAFIQAVVTLIIGLLKITFGIHTVIQLISLWLLITTIFRMKYYKSIIPVLIGFFIQGIINGIYLPVLNSFIKIDFIKMRLEFEYMFIITLPILLISIVTLFIVIRKRYTLCNVE